MGKIKDCNQPGVLKCFYVKNKPSINYIYSNNHIFLGENTWMTRNNGPVPDPTGRYDTFTYSGTNDEESAIFTIKKSEKKMEIAIRFRNGKTVNIVSCGANECLVWVEIDNNMFKDASVDNIGPKGQLTLSKKDRSLLEQGKTESSSLVEYSVQVYYTEEFESVTSDVPMFVHNMIAETNQGYATSGIPLRVRLFCAQKAADITEVNSMNSMLSKFRFMNHNITELRNTADVAVLLTSDGDSCSMSYADQPRLTLGVVKKACAINYLTFGHTTGHMFGASHNKESVSHRVPFFPYGLGNRFKRGSSPNSGLVTIMAYTTNNFKHRVNRYAGPNVNFRGTTTGSTTCDNVRLLTERRKLIAGQGDESGTCRGFQTVSLKKKSVSGSMPSGLSSCFDIYHECRELRNECHGRYWHLVQFVCRKTCQLCQ